MESQKRLLEVGDKLYTSTGGFDSRVYCRGTIDRVTAKRAFIGDDMFRRELDYNGDTKRYKSSSYEPSYKRYYAESPEILRTMANQERDTQTKTKMNEVEALFKETMKAGPELEELIDLYNHLSRYKAQIETRHEEMYPSTPRPTV